MRVINRVTQKTGDSYPYVGKSINHIARATRGIHNA